MTSHSLLNRLDWEPLSETSIELSAEQIDRAIQLAQPISDPDQQWQTYLHLLALLGFEQWLNERSPDLMLNSANCALLQPQTTALLGSVCNLEIGEFSVGLIATGSLADRVVNVPRAMIDLPAYAAQFYVLVEVLEEQEQVHIQGYGRADQLQAYRQTATFDAQRDHTYSLPVDWFSLSADNLLLNLRCLEPTVIPLLTTTQPAVSDSVAVEQVRQKLTQRSLNQPLNQSLTWEEIVTVLAHPTWLDSSIQVLDNVTPNIQGTNIQGKNIQDQARASSASAVENILNVATWFQGHLDELAQQLAWVLLPPTMQPAALRSTVTEWDLLVDNLTQSGLSLPETAACAYRDFAWEGSTLRLYAITWELVSVEPEWVLLIVLGGQPNARLPIGSRLQVRDEHQMLVEQELTASDRMYLYAQVVGHQDEQFWVSVGSNTSMLSFPAFAFRP